MMEHATPIGWRRVRGTEHLIDSMSGQETATVAEALAVLCEATAPDASSLPGLTARCDEV